MNLSDRDLYELTSSSAHSLNNVVMNLITLETLLERELSEDAMSGYRYTFSNMSERIMALASAFSLLSLLHEEKHLPASHEGDKLDTVAIQALHEKLENLYEGMLDFRCQLEADRPSPLSHELMLELILNALGFLRFGRDGQTFVVLLAEDASHSDKLICTVKPADIGQSVQGFGTSKKHCNLIALQQADRTLDQVSLIFDAEHAVIEFQFMG